VPHHDDELIAWLGDRAGEPEAGTGHESPTVGGKGASLDRLARLGFRTPPGFCLTTAAFRAQLATTVDVALATGAVDVERVAAGLATGPLEERVERALAAALRRLTTRLEAEGFEPRFAVRSSAVAEDGAASSYAGLHETELDVQPAEVPDAVRRCWASLWSAPAVAYRRRQDLSAADAAMAVVVQALIPADASAVVFTRHPVTGRDDQLVVTAVRGLGDAMVAGTVTPDTAVVEKVTRSVVEFDAGDGSSDADPALGADVLGDLVALSLGVEQGFGRPVDIEAAHAGGTWYLLQARPITTGTMEASRR
jgi:phosphoenolpyruvate synthase/pyruvate phosphate dikinase